MTRIGILGAATIWTVAAVFVALGCYLIGCGLAMLPAALFVGTQGLVAAGIAIGLGLISWMIAVGLCLRSILAWWCAAILAIAALVLAVTAAVMALRDGFVVGAAYGGGFALLALVVFLALLGVRRRFASLLDGPVQPPPSVPTVVHAEARLGVLGPDEGYAGGPIYSGLRATVRCGERSGEANVLLVGASQLAAGQEGAVRLSFVGPADELRAGMEFDLLDYQQMPLGRGVIVTVLPTSASPGRRRR